MVTEEAARQMAQEFVRSRLGHELNLLRIRFYDAEDILRRWKMANGDDLVGLEVRPFWAVAFKAFFPNGTPMDESLVVRVDAEDGVASFD